MREDPPFFRYALSHGICPECAEHFAVGEPEINESIVAYFNSLLEAGQRADLSRCKQLRDEGLALGLSAADIAFAGISGVLDQIGQAWEEGLITVADEHRATRWCESFLETMPKPYPENDELELFGTVTPSNMHNLGARLAEFVLQDWGVKAEVIVPSLPIAEVLEIVKTRKVRHVTISCGLPTAVLEATEMAQRLRDDHFEGSIILVGPAVRREAVPDTESDILLAKTIFDVIELIGAKLPPAARRMNS